MRNDQETWLKIVSDRQDLRTKHIKYLLQGRMDFDKYGLYLDYSYAETYIKYPIYPNNPLIIKS